MAGPIQRGIMLDPEPMRRIQDTVFMVSAIESEIVVSLTLCRFSVVSFVASPLSCPLRSMYRSIS
jgi:hypothetical protein